MDNRIQAIDSAVRNHDGSWAAAAVAFDAGVAAERERCAAILKARAAKIAAEAERAAKSEPDEVSALRAMAWQFTVSEREIRGA